MTARITRRQGRMAMQGTDRQVCGLGSRVPPCRWWGAQGAQDLRRVPMHLPYPYNGIPYMRKSSWWFLNDAGRNDHSRMRIHDDPSCLPLCCLPSCLPPELPPLTPQTTGLV